MTGHALAMPAVSSDGSPAVNDFSLSPPFGPMLPTTMFPARKDSFQSALDDRENTAPEPLVHSLRIKKRYFLKPHKINAALVVRKLLLTFGGRAPRVAEMRSALGS